ncbi:hypothetical protein ACEPAF_7917 [Sanghuangporus sanghuang]
MGDSRKSVPSFSSFTFKTIGSNSLFSRISDRTPEAVAVTTVEQDEGDLHVDMDVDLPEPPDLPPSLLARFSDQPNESDPLRSTFFRPNGTYSPLFLTPGPVRYETVLNGNPRDNDLNEPVCLDVASFDENRKERCTDPAEQEQNSQALFPIRPEQRSPAATLALPSRTNASIGLLTPPPSGLLASSPVNWSITFAYQASLLPKSNDSVDSVFPFTPLTKLLQEERDAWSEVLQTKQAQVDRASTCTQPLDTNERDLRAGQTDDDRSRLSGPTIPNSLPRTLLSCLPSQSQQNLSSSEVVSGAVANDKAELCSSRIPASTHDSSNSRAAFQSFLNASQRTSDKANGDGVPQQNPKDQVYPEQSSIQFTDAAKLPSPREKELKSLLKARTTSHCSGSDRAPDGGTYTICSRLSPTASKHENSARPNDPTNPERVSTTDSFGATELPTPPIVKTDMPSSRIQSTNLQRLQNDGLKISSPQSSRNLSTRIHSEPSPRCSSIAAIQQDPKQLKPRDGLMKESLGSETSRISSQVSKASVFAPNPVIRQPPPTSEPHAPHSRVTSFRSSDGGEAKGAVDRVPVVKTEDSDGGSTGPTTGSTMDTSTKIKKEEQEDIKIRLKVEEDSKPLPKDKYIFQIPARDCPKVAKKEEDRDGMLILHTNANAQASSRKKSISQAEHSRKVAYAPVQQVDIRQKDRYDGATETGLAINKPTDNTEPSRSLGTKFENTLSAQEPAPADSLVQAELATPPPFSREAAADDSVGAEPVRRDLSEQVPSRTASQNAKAQLAQPEPLSINDNSYRGFSPRRRTDSWVPETSRHVRQRSRDRECPTHLLDHWSPPRLSGPRTPAPVRSRPVADTYRPLVSLHERAPRRFRDDLRDEHDEDRLPRRLREGRARFSPEYLPDPPFRGRSSPPRRTDRNRARDSPPHRNTCAFDTRFASSHSNMRATIPRPCSPHTSRSHVGFEEGQEHNNRNMLPRREVPRSPVNNTQHNLYSDQLTAHRRSDDAPHHDSRYIQQHANGAAQGLPSPERRFVPDSTYMRAMGNERTASIHDIDVAENAVNGRQEASASPWNEGTFYTGDQSSQDASSKTIVCRDEMNTSANSVSERREKTVGSSDLLVPPTQSHTTMPLSTQPSRPYISELRVDTLRDLPNAQPATKRGSVSGRSEENVKKNVLHEVVESNATATSHIYGRDEDGKSQTGDRFGGCRVEKDIRPSRGSMAEKSSLLSPSDPQNATGHTSLPSSNTPMLNRLSAPASSLKRQAAKGSASHISQTNLSTGAERSGQTSSMGKAEENAKSRSLAQRIDNDSAGSIGSMQQLGDFTESPRSPIPSLSSRLGDILICDGSDHLKERAASKPVSLPSDLPLGSRITGAKLEAHQAKHPLPPKPVPRQASPTITTQDPRSTINPPVLLKRMRSLTDDNDSYRPVKQSRGRGAAGGRGRGRGNNGSHYSPRGSFHASPSSKRSLEDRLS